MRTLLLLFLKLLVSGATGLLIWQKIDFQQIWTLRSNFQPGLLFVALLIYIFGQMVSAQRFVYVARVLGERVRLRVSLRIHFVGLWFNQILPSGLGGDLVKGGLFVRDMGLNRAVRSVILDRLSGLVVLLAFVIVLLPVYQSRLHIWPLTIGLAFLSFLFFAVLVLVPLLVPEDIWERLIPLALRGVGQVFHDVPRFRRKGPLLEQAWSSTVVHLCGVISYALIGLALGVQLDFLGYMLMAPLVFLVALLPISFAGWGVREAGAVGFFGLLNVPQEQALAISVLFGLMLIAAGLPGIVLMLVKRSS